MQALNTALPGPASLIPRPLPDFTGDVFFKIFYGFEIKFGYGLGMRLWPYHMYVYLYKMVVCNLIPMSIAVI